MRFHPRPQPGTSARFPGLKAALVRAALVVLLPSPAVQAQQALPRPPEAFTGTIAPANAQSTPA